MERRRFIVKAGGVLAAAGAAAVVNAPNVIAQPKVQWRMSTTWSAALDVLQGSAQQVAKLVDEMSGGRFKIEVFPGGQIMPHFACFDAASPGAEIYAALERGVIDAAEWVGPHDDMKLGLQNTAPNYYFPGWHEPGNMNEYGFNKKAYEALPVDLQRTLDHAVAATQVYGLMEYEAKNAIALEKLKTEFRGKVEILQLPAPVLGELRKLASEVIKEESEKSPMAKKVYAAFTKFRAQLAGWSRISEGAYHQFVGL